MPLHNVKVQLYGCLTSSPDEGQWSAAIIFLPLYCLKEIQHTLHVGDWKDPELLLSLERRKFPCPVQSLYCRCLIA
jgi:hypothetical protein